MKLTAKLPETPRENGKNYSGDKEMTSVYSVVGKVKGKLSEIVDARCWMGRSRNAMTVYASLWARGHSKYLAGNGSAGGGGYHKPSAAIDSAIDSAGVELFDGEKRVHIDGVGDGAIQEALLAIARELADEGTESRWRLNFPMAKTRNDLTGQTFGRLTVLSDSGRRTRCGRIIWHCSCDCGNIADIDGHGLLRGTAKSCGCLRRELSASRARRKNIRTNRGVTRAGVDQDFD